MKIDILAIKYP
jgi:hypothetical protein